MDLRNVMKLAVEKAREFQGATAPNPPVGAAALDRQGRILSIQAHERAGTLHAEARVIADCGQRGLLGEIHTFVVTLEPCNHFGRTPPCTEAILGKTPAKKVIYGAQDPNPKVAGGGAERLRSAGLEVVKLDDPDCQELIEPFSRWIRTGLPFITLKTAHLGSGQLETTMIPPPGQKTFTSAESLKFAHLLRRSSDAILTGSGTVLADDPEFTVRHVPDHPGKQRWLVVMDRRKRTPRSWIQAREKQGFRVIQSENAEDTLRFLGSQGVLEVLVEAGPSLTHSLLSGSLWNRHVLITRAYDGDKGPDKSDKPDKIEVRRP